MSEVLGRNLRSSLKENCHKKRKSFEAEDGTSYENNEKIHIISAVKLGTENVTAVPGVHTNVSNAIKRVQFADTINGFEVFAEAETEPVIAEVQDELKQYKRQPTQSLGESTGPTVKTSIPKYSVAMKSQRIAATITGTRSQREYAEFKGKSEETLRIQKEQLEQKMEETMNAHRDELANLKAELNKRQNDMDAFQADKRNILNSLNDVQKQASEDKASLRSEISTLLQIISQLATKKEESALDVAQKESTLSMLESKLGEKEREAATNSEAANKLESLKELLTKSEYRENCAVIERQTADCALRAIQTEHNAVKREMEERFTATIDTLRTELSVVKSNAAEEQRRLTDSNIRLECLVKEQELAITDCAAYVNQDTIREMAELKATLEITQKNAHQEEQKLFSTIINDAEKIAKLEQDLHNAEVARRKLHNQVQELRGNIRVFARLRPFLPNDGHNMDALPAPVVDVKQDLNKLIIKNKVESGARAESHEFAFDRVFNQSISQEAVFNEVSEFVQSALDGYNVCLFSYGQTGSGKTFTMQGSGRDNMRGIIPRAMEQVGKYKSQLEAKGWCYQMEVSFIEIYNEVIRDLLRDDKVKNVKHELKGIASGDIYVSDVKMVTVDPNNAQEIDDIMERAARHRSVASTAMNEESSRSHSIFTLHLKASNAAQGIVLKGNLHLVDLAGSERLDRSMATGTHQNEAIGINKSLSALAGVFLSIANKNPHHPFRDSVLTQLLKPTLSGDGKTLMMVNLSPTEASFQETLCSLRLARQVNQCEMGKPKKQIADSTANKDTKDNKNGKSVTMEVCTSSTTAATPSRTRHLSMMSVSGPLLSMPMSAMKQQGRLGGK